jgi:retinol-binding protein 3
MAYARILRLALATPFLLGPGLLLGGLPTNPARPADVPTAQLSLGLKGPDRSIDAATRTEVIDKVLAKLNELYIFPDVAKKMEEAIRARVERKEYDQLSSAAAFAEALTTHLRDVCHDKHLRVLYSAEPTPKEAGPREPTPEMRATMRRRMAARNYGFEKVERLDGNVGYLSLLGFMDAEFAGDTAAAAMNFLADTDSLIIDLRRNGGGSPAMVALICSYLFPAQPVHLNDLYNRQSNATHQWWTLPYVPGKRYVGKDVYVLTSKRTFSAAEEFTYNLKNLKRATIVGETTGGGAHPVGGYPVHTHFVVVVPVSRAINPITKTNWEGTGVTPDVAVPQEQALKTAYLAALKKQREKAKEKMETEELDRLIKMTTAELEGKKLDPK